MELVGTLARARRSAAAVSAAAGIYGDIGRKVRALGPSAWDGRVSTSTASKLWWAAKAQGLSAARHRLWGLPAVREGLWTQQALCRPNGRPPPAAPSTRGLGEDRKSAVQRKSVAVRVKSGCRTASQSKYQHSHNKHI